MERQDILLLIDEAHNCGDVITGIESVTLEERDLEQASRECPVAKAPQRRTGGLGSAPRAPEFIRGLPTPPKRKTVDRNIDRRPSGDLSVSR